MLELHLHLQVRTPTEYADGGARIRASHPSSASRCSVSCLCGRVSRLPAAAGACAHEEALADQHVAIGCKQGSHQSTHHSPYTDAHQTAVANRLSLRWRLVQENAVVMNTSCSGLHVIMLRHTASARVESPAMAALTPASAAGHSGG